VTPKPKGKKVEYFPKLQEAKERRTADAVVIGIDKKTEGSGKVHPLKDTM